MCLRSLKWCHQRKIWLLCRNWTTIRTFWGLFRSTLNVTPSNASISVLQTAGNISCIDSCCIVLSFCIVLFSVALQILMYCIMMSCPVLSFLIVSCFYFTETYLKRVTYLAGKNKSCLRADCRQEVSAWGILIKELNKNKFGMWGLCWKELIKSNPDLDWWLLVIIPASQSVFAWICVCKCVSV